MVIGGFSAAPDLHVANGLGSPKQTTDAHKNQKQQGGVGQAKNRQDEAKKTGGEAGI
ncbi:MAG TPA: hypothetical protein PLO62_10080 [Candidatus Hydrogenedentes bacterium]|nr:hypothetical protein [Candidatus Hydrogenedentota bacterium]HOS02046.1 hypothetical protein [Candidatus Hydrogenedentota bacterium]